MSRQAAFPVPRLRFLFLLLLALCYPGQQQTQQQQKKKLLSLVIVPTVRKPTSQQDSIDASCDAHVRTSLASNEMLLLNDNGNYGYRGGSLSLNNNFMSLYNNFIRQGSTIKPCKSLQATRCYYLMIMVTMVTGVVHYH